MTGTAAGSTQEGGSAGKSAHLASAQRRTASSASDCVVRAMNLHKTYRSGDSAVHAVSGISFDVRRGEIVGVLGPNGAGKTTSVSCLEGLVVPDAGQIEIFGLSPFVRDHIQIIRSRSGVSMQNGVLPPLVKVRELLTFKAALYDNPRPIEPLLEALGLAEKADIQYRHLSGGQQQRTILAMALVGNPELLLLDEPTSQLDPQARRAVWEILDDQRRHCDAAILVTTHQMEEAQRLCDRVIIIDNGKVIGEGSPRELIAQHCPMRTIEFTTRSDSDLSSLCGAEKIAGDSPGKARVRIESDATDSVLSDIIALQHTGHLSIGQINIVEQTLEDVFLKLTGRAIH